jgi:hypothetical protein
MDFGQRLGQENLGLKIADILPDLDLRIEGTKEGQILVQISKSNDPSGHRIQDRGLYCYHFWRIDS